MDDAAILARIPADRWPAGARLCQTARLLLVAGAGASWDRRATRQGSLPAGGAAGAIAASPILPILSQSSQGHRDLPKFARAAVCAAQAGGGHCPPDWPGRRRRSSSNRAGTTCPRPSARTARSDRLADRRRDRRRHPAPEQAGDHPLGPSGHQQDRHCGGRGQQPGPNGARCGRAAGHAAGAAVLAQDRRGPGGGDRRDLPPGGAGCLTGRRRPSCGVADRRGWPAKGGACFNINQCGDSIPRGLSRVRSSSTGGFHGPDKRHPDP